MGPLVHPETSVQNYECNISEECRSDMMIWQCLLWYVSTWCGSERSS